MAASSGRGSRFVAIPAERLVAELEYCGKKTQEIGGSYSWSLANHEKLFELRIPKKRSVIRVYTSLAEGEDNVRDCGQDAVRIVIGIYIDGDFRPVRKSITIKRTASTKASDRVGEFLGRLRENLRDAFMDAQKIKKCKCGSFMVERQGSYGAFYGCISYPRCKNIEKI
jgi:hypothetical protein